MDSNSPNYAKWIPEAGGYVHNGSVISKTPIYGENGLQEVDVDISKLAQPTVGATQQNQAGSGQDVNAAVVGVGSLASLNNNTANTEYGPLNTPATQSQVAEGPVLSPVDQIMKDIEYGVATNNLKMQIDGYTKLGQIQNADYSQIINNLNKQRNQKIMSQDDAYSKAYSDAVMMGDYPRANQIMQQQADYRDKVGYQDAMQNQLQTEQQELDIDFDDTFRISLNDIANGILASIPGLINFQYDPTQDRALQVAQEYAIGAVKEQMNHTGMYYSSMTQNAITRAVAELVPVYEKMAKDEIKENINTLMNVGNYLMKLEQSQFDIWKQQIQLKWDANQEKRKEYQAALDRANALGYVSNKDAAILSVAPGSLSPDAMNEIRTQQLQIDKEQRALQNDKELARFKADLDIEYAQRSAAIKAQYAANTSTPGATAKTTVTYNDDGTISYKTTKNFDRELTPEEVEQIKANNANASENGTAYTGKMTATDLTKTYSSDNTSLSPSDKLAILDAVRKDAKSENDEKEAIASIKDGNGKAIFDKDILTQSGVKGVRAYIEAMDTDGLSSTDEDGFSILVGLQNKYGGDVISKDNVGLAYLLDSNISGKQKVIEKYLDAYVKPKINSSNYAEKDSGKLRGQQLADQKLVEEFAAPLMANKEITWNNSLVEKMYGYIIDKITSTKDYDISKGWFDTGTKGRSQGIQNLLINIKSVHGNDGRWLNVITNLQNKAKDLENSGKITDWNSVKDDWDVRDNDFKR